MYIIPIHFFGDFSTFFCCFTAQILAVFRCAAPSVIPYRQKLRSCFYRFFRLTQVGPPDTTIFGISLWNALFNGPIEYVIIYSNGLLLFSFSFLRRLGFFQPEYSLHFQSNLHHGLYEYNLYLHVDNSIYSILLRFSGFSE